MNVYLTRNRKVKVSSFKEASEMCRNYIKTNGLGASRFFGGKIENDDGTYVAYVSYNGRVWDGPMYSWNTDTKEIIF